MTPASTRDLIIRHWDAANARDWAAFEALLHPELRYEVPQTREFIEGREGYLALFRTWPGDWRARITSLTCEGDRGVCIIDFIDPAETMTGISIFDVSSDRITAVTDYWPAPYEPPPRATTHMQRRPPQV